MSCKAQTLHLFLLSAPFCQQHSFVFSFFWVWQKIKVDFYFLALLQFPKAATVATAASQFIPQNSEDDDVQ